MRRIRDPKRLDRDLWLSRFSDLMLNGIQFPANSPIDLAAWRRAVREGECGIFMRGYSHNIFDLNAKPNATEHFPLLWIIHDEFAEWMMTEDYAEAVADIVGRLGVKARAAGISLVFAAQRPDANVMPMQLRANLGNRLVLRVDGEGTSEIALGEKGAERLLGKGHLAARLEGEQAIVFGQVPYVQSSFLAEVVDTLKAIHH